MKNEKEILEEVEKTLNAFDYDRELDENPFLYTRIVAGLKDKKRKRIIPVIHFGLNKALLFLILVLNIVTLVYYYDKSEKKNVETQFETALKADFTIDQSENIF